MSRFIFLFLALFLASLGFAQQQMQDSGSAGTDAWLMTGIGNLHHPVSTKSQAAQRYFDQGLTLVYGFNHGAAIHSFEKAAKLDPNLAMAYWGIALATGPNYNEPEVEFARNKAAHEACEKAKSFYDTATQVERDYIDAMARRFSADEKADFKKLGMDYRDAMKALVQQYPDDLDAATIYAESMMDLNAWKLYSLDGKSAEGTDEIVTVLESVLRRNPLHVGANHLYIHAVEASASPERALPSAKRLETLVPAAGHLVHMPAHIYIRVGDHPAAAKSNADAIVQDRAYFKKSGDQGMYRAMYYNHNIHFLSYASMMEGRFLDAFKAGREVTANAGPLAKDIPMVEAFVPWSTFVLVRFRKWDQILKEPAPDQSLNLTNTIWRFARTMAFVATGNMEKAEQEHKEFEETAKKVPADQYVGFSKASDVIGILEHLMDAQIAIFQKDLKSAAEHYTKAVEKQDTLSYDEPPDFFYPVRESLGATYLRLGDSKEAERVFREDLARNPRNGRSLFGLLEALRSQGRTSDAFFIQQQFDAAWKNADTKLQIEDL